MKAIRVRKRFELQGSDERDLERRMELLRQALSAQSGVILAIKWNGQNAEPSRSASIIYQIPIDAAELEVPAA